MIICFYVLRASGSVLQDYFGFIDRQIIWGLSLSEAFSALTINDIKITVNLNLPCA